jgi:hypothetical protein
MVVFSLLLIVQLVGHLRSCVKQNEMCTVLFDFAGVEHGLWRCKAYAKNVVKPITASRGFFNW